MVYCAGKPIESVVYCLNKPLDMKNVLNKLHKDSTQATERITDAFQ